MKYADLLPEEYLKRMEKALGDEFKAFLSCYDQPPVKALRFNPRKARPETVEMLRKWWKLEPVPWCADGWYYKENELVRPGLSPYHDAGVFYIQEPSAMITAEKAAIGPEDIVLDLCAAPGGKSTQAAAKCKVLLSNEPIPGRARTLSSNIERMGFDHVIVTSAYPDALADCKGLRGFFTRVIVDAPCSGEGMMRKDETAIREWSPENVEKCIERQKDILESAAVLVSPGGRLVYSTCTFEYGENEGQIKQFLEEHTEFRLLESETLYPHQIRGEGHFCAVLEKTGDGLGAAAEPAAGLEKSRSVNKAGTANADGASANTYGGSVKSASGDSEETGKIMNQLRKHLQKNKIHVLRCGVEPGETVTDRRGKSWYEPSHAEALAGVFGGDGQNCVNLKQAARVVADAYLKGNVIDLSVLAPDTYELHSGGGWLTVQFDGYPLGLGKLSGMQVKNHYPKGLRHL